MMNFILVDVTCYYNGFHGDLNETLLVGNVDDDSKLLVKTAYDSLMAAVSMGKRSQNMCILKTICDS